MKERIMHITIRLILATWLTLVGWPAFAQTPMSKVALLAPDSVASLSWATVAPDAAGDGFQKRLPDARELSYAIDPRAGLIWFKVRANAPLPERWFGINVAIDTDGSADNGMAWWGTNKIKFDRLASAYLSGEGSDWQGYVGVADSESVGRGYMSNLSRDVKVAVDRSQHAIVIGFPLSLLGNAPNIRVIATVGSMIANNDDVPNEGMASVRLR